MIIRKDEIAKFERHLKRVCEVDSLARQDLYLPNEDPLPSYRYSPLFVAEYPHLLMPLGFDEFRAINQESTEDPLYPRIVEWVYPYEVFFRQTNTGAWAHFDGFSDNGGWDSRGSPRGRVIRPGTPHAHFIWDIPHVPGKGDWSFPLDELISRLHGIADSPDDVYRQIVLPGLWTPKAQAFQAFTLSQSVRGILCEIAFRQKDLSSVAWRELEEIVAELLRSQGMQVSVTKPSKDGGRDVIARGQLLPGEPTILAVEVKKKPVVGLHDVRCALQANQDFPALLLATSGRFSGGVISEKQRERNQLRLFLKDGVAVSQWIEEWARRQRGNHSGR